MSFSRDPPRATMRADQKCAAMGTASSHAGMPSRTQAQTLLMCLLPGPGLTCFTSHCPMSQGSIRNEQAASGAYFISRQALPSLRTRAAPRPLARPRRSAPSKPPWTRRRVAAWRCASCCDAIACLATERRRVHAEQPGNAGRRAGRAPAAPLSRRASSMYAFRCPRQVAGCARPCLPLCSLPCQLPSLHAPPTHPPTHPLFHPVYANPTQNLPLPASLQEASDLERQLQQARQTAERLERLRWAGRGGRGFRNWLLTPA